MLKSKTKTEVVVELAAETGTTRRECKAIYDLVFDKIIDELARGAEVKITNFGIFRPRQDRARPGRNPRTGVALSIPATTRVAFKPSDYLKESIQPENAE